MLIGQRRDAILEIVRAHPALNLERNPQRYLIDPRDHFAARREARRLGLDVIGFFHSHPGGPATPSPSDVAEASYPDHVYVIVGLARLPSAVHAEDADVAAFYYRNGRFEEVRLDA